MDQFFKTIELIATVKQTFTVTADNCEAMYGVSLDALDDHVVREAERGDTNEGIWAALFDGDSEIADFRFVVSELQQRDA